MCDMRVFAANWCERESQEQQVDRIYLFVSRAKNPSTKSHTGRRATGGILLIGHRTMRLIPKRKTTSTDQRRDSRGKEQGECVQSRTERYITEDDHARLPPSSQTNRQKTPPTNETAPPTHRDDPASVRSWIERIYRRRATQRFDSLRPSRA